MRRRKKRKLDEARKAVRKHRLKLLFGNWVAVCWLIYYLITIGFTIYAIVTGEWALPLGMWILPIIIWSFGGGLTTNDLLWLIWIDKGGKD